MINKLDISKYKRLAKILQIIVRLFFIVSVIGAVAAVVVGIILSVIDTNILSGMIEKGGDISLSSDNTIMFMVNPIDATVDNIKPILTYICIMVCAATSILAVIFKQLELILGTVKDDKPFAAANSQRLSIIGITLIIGSFVLRAGEYLVASTLIHTFKLFNVSANYAADTNMLIMGFVVLVLAGVFKYGSFLQQEYDSTV